MKFLPNFHSPRSLFPIFTALVASIFLWAAIFEIDTSVLMPGELRPLGQSVRIQNRFEGKVSSDIPLVGQKVTAGDVLFTLETDVDQAAAEENAIQLASVEARLARLRAQVSLQPELVAARVTEGEPEQLADQQVILTAVLETLQSQLSILDSERESAEAESLSLSRATGGIEEAVDVADKKLRLVRQLYQDGYEGELAFLEARQAKVEAARALNQHLVQIEQLEGKIQSLRERRLSELSKFKSQAAEELAATIDEFNTLRARRESLTARFDEYVIVAPVSGTIGRMHVNNVGEVLTPGALIAEVIPEGVPIVFYGRLQEMDLADVAAGQRARVTLSFMDTRSEKPLDASVLSVDPDVTVNEDGSRFYSVVVDLLEGRDGVTLYPGSGGSAFLITGRRTVLAYLFEPIYDVFTKALREN